MAGADTGASIGEKDAILLIDHGSRRKQANALLDEVVALVREKLGSSGIVEAAHMEIAEPTIDQGFARCVELGAKRIIVHPFMLAPGRHVSEDLPRLVARCAAAYDGVSFVMASPLGSHTGVIDAVVDRCMAAAGSKAG